MRNCFVLFFENSHRIGYNNIVNIKTKNILNFSNKNETIIETEKLFVEMLELAAANLSLGCFHILVFYFLSVGFIIVFLFVFFFENKKN